eukprot:14131203-Alexandrium_andersonii.AAC.1
MCDSATERSSSCAGSHWPHFTQALAAALQGCHLAPGATQPWSAATRARPATGRPSWAQAQ